MTVESYDTLLELVKDERFGHMTGYTESNGKIMDEINRLLRDEAAGDEVEYLMTAYKHTVLSLTEDPSDENIIVSNRMIARSYAHAAAQVSGEAAA